MNVTRWLVIVFLFASMMGCTRKAEEGNSFVNFRLPSTASSVQQQSIHTSSIVSGWALATPTAMSDINCWMIMVEGPLMPVTGRCYNSSDSLIATPGMINGPYPSGSTISIEVPQGQRKFYLLGVKASSTSYCQNKNIDQTYFSAPVIVGVTEKVLLNPEETVSLSASMSGAVEVKSCEWSKFAYSVTDKIPTVSISLGSMPAGESGTAVANVTLDKPSAQTITIAWATQNVTATSAVDFVAGSGTLTFSPGQTSKTISVVLTDDASVEPSETFLVTLSSPTNALLSTTPSLTMTILDDEVGTPTAPTAVTLSSPASTPSTSASISIDVLGVAAGDTVQLFTDASCSIGPVGSITASGATATISVSGITPNVPKVYYAQRVNANGTSPCSTSAAAYEYDATVPTATLSSGSSNPLNGPFSMSFVFSENVTGFTSTDITVTNGTISGFSGAGTSYSATITPTTDGIVNVSLAGSVCNDVAGNSNSASATFSRTFDSIVPTVTSVNSSFSNITYYIGDPISIQVNFSENVNVTGAPHLALSNGATAIYSSGSGTSQLTFNYVVALSDSASSDLDYLNSGALTLNGGTIYDAATNAATLTLAAPGASGSLAFAKQLVIANYYLLSLSSVYTSNDKWNDYIRFSNNSNPPYLQPNTACDGTETGHMNMYNGCVHAGEIRKVTATGQSTCTLLTASDSLGAFDWICDGSTNPVSFYSTRLKAGKGLRDLISGGGTWNPLSVTVLLAGSITVGVTSSTVWWSNPIALLPDTGSPDALSIASNIYYTNSNVVSAGYRITSNKVGIVTLGASEIQYDNAVDYNANATCSAAGFSSSSLICAYNTKFSWIEANMTGGTGAFKSRTGIFLSNVKATRVHRSQILGLRNTSNTVAAIELDLSSFNWFDDITVRQVGVPGGLRLSSSHGNTFTNFSVSENISGTDAALMTVINTSNNNRFNNIRLANNIATSALTYGFLLDSGSGNSISNISVSNINSSGSAGGIYLKSGATNTIVTQAAISNTNDAGIVLDSSSANIFTHVTSANNFYNGVYLKGTINNSYFNNLLIMNADKGFETDVSFTGTGNLVRNIVSADNLNNPIYLAGTGSNVIAFTGTIGKSGSCYNGSGIATSLDTACNNGASPITVMSLASVVGKVGVTDASNNSNTGGGQVYGSITDWLKFSTWFRSWGLDGTAFPNTSNKGVCTTGTCRIWDWRVLTAGILYDRSEVVGTTNGTFTNSSPCPVQASGSYSTTQGSYTFLRNAVEVTTDGIGNNNGLCESNEKCVYAPNMGAYQGEGDFTTQTCTFSGGAVNGVTMYAYPTRGQ